MKTFVRHLEPPAWLLTMCIVCFAWIFFRAATFGEAFEVISGIVSLSPSPAHDSGGDESPR